MQTTPRPLPTGVAIEEVTGIKEQRLPAALSRQPAVLGHDRADRDLRS